MSVTYGTSCRFLDRAAIVEPGAGEDAFGPWRLSTVTQVEETKLVLAMVPIWVCTLPFGMAVAQVSTFFIKQGSVMAAPGPALRAPAGVHLRAVGAHHDRRGGGPREALVPYLRRATGEGSAGSAS